MKVDCAVINDLLPLYADEACSKETTELVEEHLQKCDKCKATLKNLKSEFQISETEVEQNLIPQKAITRYSRHMIFSASSISIFGVTMILNWISLFSVPFVWLNWGDKGDSLLTLWLFILLAILVISGVTYMVSLIRGWKNKEKKNRIKNAIMAFVFLLLIGAQLVFTQFVNNSETHTSGLTDIISKEKNKSSYSFVILDLHYKETVTFECNKQTFDQLIVDKNVLYDISYRSVKYFNKVYGALESINTGDMIDNRRSTSSDSSNDQTSSGSHVLYTHFDKNEFACSVPFGTNIIEFKKSMKNKNVTFIVPKDAKEHFGIREDGGLIGSDPRIYFNTKGIDYIFWFNTNGSYTDENFVLNELSITDKNYKTKKGLSVGDPVSKMKTLYGNNYNQYGDDTEFDYHGDTEAVNFTSKNGIITGISIVKDINLMG